jgi:hypothetical protein
MAASRRIRTQIAMSLLPLWGNSLLLPIRWLTRTGKFLTALRAKEACRAMLPLIPSANLSQPFGLKNRALKLRRA